MNKNKIYYATINNKYGYGNQYRLIKEDESFIIQILTIVNNHYSWQNLNIDSNINLSTLTSTLDYINENIETKSNTFQKKKILTKKHPN